MAGRGGNAGDRRVRGVAAPRPPRRHDRAARRSSPTATRSPSCSTAAASRTRFDIELERARRSDAPLSLVVADIDGLARVNQTLGHAAGDEALRAVAAALRAVKRSFDSAARVGGEEFALIAPGLRRARRLHAGRARAHRRGHGVGGRRPEPHDQPRDRHASRCTAARPRRCCARRTRRSRPPRGSGRDRTVISSAEVSGAGRARAARRRRDEGGAGLAARASPRRWTCATPAARATPSAWAGSPS